MQPRGKQVLSLQWVRAGLTWEGEASDDHKEGDARHQGTLATPLAWVPPGFRHHLLSQVAELSPRVRGEAFRYFRSGCRRGWEKSPFRPRFRTSQRCRALGHTGVWIGQVEQKAGSGALVSRMGHGAG